MYTYWSRTKTIDHLETERQRGRDEGRRDGMLASEICGQVRAALVYPRRWMF
jgi:hypothetical protein